MYKIPNMINISEPPAIISYEPYKLMDEVSSQLFYIGTSNYGNVADSAVWKIKKIEKIGNVWTLAAYPDGNQEYKYIWNNRENYNYI
jgi:hypothetical protein